MNKVQAYFKDHTSKTEVHETSDGLLFHEKGDANLHTNSLSDKEVKTHSAAKNQPSEDSGDAAAKAAEDAAKKEAAEKKAAEAAAKKEAAEAKKKAAAEAKAAAKS